MSEEKINVSEFIKERKTKALGEKKKSLLNVEIRKDEFTNLKVKFNKQKEYFPTVNNVYPTLQQLNGEKVDIVVNEWGTRV